MRFPEFSEPWTQTTLGEICQIVGGGTPSTEVEKYWEGDIPWFTPSEIRKKYIEHSERTITEEGLKNSGARLLPKGAILLTTRATIGECSISTTPCCTNQGFQSLVVYPNKSTTEFVYQKVQTLRNELLIRANGSTFKEITAQEIRGIHIFTPTMKEQEKIATFLSLIDERIETQRQTISHLYSLSIGLYQCILSKYKERWSKVFLRDVMTVRKEKNSKNAEVHSVSVKRGILNQIEHLGRSFAAKDTKHYSLVCNGDLVYTKSPTGQFPFGIVKQSFIEKEVAVSPLYGVYIPTNIHVGRIIHNFFLSPVRTSSYLATLIQKGAKNTMNITTEHFLDNKIYLPSDIEEQEAIARFLIKLDERIEVEEMLLQKYEEQKRYLLRKMFV